MVSKKFGRRAVLDAAVAQQRNELPAPRFVDTPAAAAYLSVTRKQLESWRTAGCGPRYSKLGRLVRYAVADLNEFMSARVVNSTSEGVRP